MADTTVSADVEITSTEASALASLTAQVADGKTDLLTPTAANAATALEAFLDELLALAALGNPPADGKWLQGDSSAEGGISEKGWAERNAWYWMSGLTIDPTKGINQCKDLSAGVNELVLGAGAEDGATYRIRLFQPTSGSTPATITLAATSPDVVKIASSGTLPLTSIIGGWNDLMAVYCSSGRFATAPTWSVYLLSDVGP